MTLEFNRTLKNFTIFALVEPNKKIAYIAKSTSPRISAVYSRHICGGSAATRNYFNVQQKPELHLLETLKCTGSEAYKHVLAWISIFMEAGYDCLNPCGTLDQADEPFMDTNALIQQFQAEPFEAMMQRTLIQRPANADKIIREKAKPAPAAEIAESVTQMNVRIHHSDKLIFDEFCRSFSVNQREGFSLLLDKAVDNSEHFQNLLLNKEKKISELQEENTKLKSKISVLNGEHTDPLIVQYRKYLSLIRDGVKAYLPALDFYVDEKPLKPMTSKQFMRSQWSVYAYFYPENEGHMEITLDALLWSKSKTQAIFVLGTGSDGRKYKFRYYPKTYYIGYGFWDCPYFYSGVKCFLVYTKANDGAMDVIGAFPLSEDEDGSCDNFYEESDKSLSVDEKIRRASLRTK